jgi:hypothetical protein
VRFTLRAALVDERQVRVERLTEPLGDLDASRVRGHDDDVLLRQAGLVRDVVGDERECRQVIEREVEVPLDLAAVQVDGHHAVRAGDRDEVGEELRGDGLARHLLLVLP